MNDLPKLIIRVTGPNVGEARLAASDLAEIIRRTQQALQRVGQVLYGQESVGKGRKKRDIEELCQLFVVAWEKGSSVVSLELATPPDQLSFFGYIGEQSIQAFLDGMEAIATVSPNVSALPWGIDMGVLQTCDAMGRVLDHGIDQITFHSENHVPSKKVIYDRTVRDRVEHLLGCPRDLTQTTKIGRLEVISGHGGLTGRLWEPDGTRWTCHFKLDHIDLLSEAWMRNVKLTGRAIIEEGKERILEVDSMMVVDEEIAAEDLQMGADFWESRTLEELAEQQGVSAASDLDEISALWPADDDPDELLDHILLERSERRKLQSS
jgi:hypothetical protein